MHYELQMKLYNIHNNEERWDKLESFYDTDYGIKEAYKRYNHMVAVDKNRTFRLVAVETLEHVLAG